jgi:hypothetical protein
MLRTRTASPTIQRCQSSHAICRVMATTSQTHSLIPTNTFTSSCSTPTDDPNGCSGDSISDLFSWSGSPPLIVAFLTIGLFVLAVIGVCGWRCISPSHGVVRQPDTTNRRPTSISLGKRPILWDVWADAGVGKNSPVGAARWENITVRLVVQSRGWATALILDSRGGFQARDSRLDVSDSPRTTTAR